MPGKTMPAIAMIEHDYTKIYDKWITLGENITKGNGMKGLGWKSDDLYEEIRTRKTVTSTFPWRKSAAHAAARTTLRCEFT